jgi:hypothetical protein
LFEIAASITDDNVLRCPEHLVTMRLTVNLWRACGLQSVRMPHTFAAALMATDLGDAVHDVHMPWPGFEIQVPSGLLLSPRGAPVHSIVVASVERACFVGMHDDHGSTWYRDDDSLAAIARADAPPCSGSESLGDLFSPELEKRSWRLVQRLVAGVALSIAAERASKPGAYAARPRREKHGLPRANEFVLGKPLKLDCRQAIRDFLQGKRATSPTVTTLVRGHWRHQTHGPHHSLRRLQWIQPFFRGEGPLLVRPTHIGGAP